MAYYRDNGSKKNIGMIIITLIFALIGLVCIIIGYKNEVLNWLKTMGIVMVVVMMPVLIWFAFRLISKKIKEM